MSSDVPDSQTSAAASDAPQSAVPHKAFPLALAQEGETVCIIAYRAGKGLEHKLRAMGLPVGVRARVIQHKGSGVVLGINATRIALGASVAQQVYVELAGETAGCRPGNGQCVRRGAGQRLDGEGG